MHDRMERTDIEIAYIAASKALADEAANRRRRAAVLAAVRDACADATRRVGRPPANEPRWRPGPTWWGASAAACLLGLSALLLLRFGDEAAVTREPRQVSSSGASGTSGGAAADAVVAGKVAPDVAAGSAVEGATRSLEVRSNSAPLAGKTKDRPASPPSSAGVPSSNPSEAAYASADAAALRAAASSVAQRESRAADPAAAQDAGPALTVPAESDRHVAEARRSGQTADAVASLESLSAQHLTSAAAKARLATPSPTATGAVAARAGAPEAASRAESVRPSGGLITAVMVGDLESVERQLVASRPDDEVDRDGRTALALAVLRSDARMVSLLIAHGANRMLPDRQGKSPLDHATAMQNPAVMEALQRK
jgi:hypothetical protein